MRWLDGNIKKLVSTDGQMTVELACVLPVMIVLALILLNVMVFLNCSAEFERTALQAIVIHGEEAKSSSDLAQKARIIEELLSKVFENNERVSFAVTIMPEKNSAGTFKLLSLIPQLYRYECEMTYTPYPLKGLFGIVDYEAPLVLTQKVSLVVDTYRKGFFA